LEKRYAADEVRMTFIIIINAVLVTAVLIAAVSPLVWAVHASSPRDERSLVAATRQGTIAPLPRFPAALETVPTSR
jgi:hypothetical protein